MKASRMYIFTHEKKGTIVIEDFPRIVTKSSYSGQDVHQSQSTQPNTLLKLHRFVVEVNGKQSYNES
jgi:hypothetical protein